MPTQPNWPMFQKLWGKIDTEAAEALKGDPKLLQSLDALTTGIRTQLESFGLDLTDDTTLYAVAASALVMNYQALIGACDEHTRMHSHITLSHYGYALGQLRRSADEARIIATLDYDTPAVES